MGNSKDSRKSSAVNKLNRYFMNQDPKKQEDLDSNKDSEKKSNDALPELPNSNYDGKVVSEMKRIGKFNLTFKDAGIEIMFKSIIPYTEAALNVDNNKDASKRQTLLIKESKALSKLRKKVTLTMQHSSRYPQETIDVHVYTMLLASSIYSTLLKGKIKISKVHIKQMGHFVDTFENFLISPEEMKFTEDAIQNGKLEKGSYFDSYLSQFTYGAYVDNESLQMNEYSSDHTYSSTMLVGALTIFIFTLGMISSYNQDSLTAKEKEAYLMILDLMKGKSPMLKFTQCHFDAMDNLYGVKKDVKNRDFYSHSDMIYKVINILTTAHETTEVHGNRFRKAKIKVFDHKISIPIRKFILPSHLRVVNVHPAEKTLQDVYGIHPSAYLKVKGLIDALI